LPCPGAPEPATHLAEGTLPYAAPPR
jgi:hypothetical protein